MKDLLQNLQKQIFDYFEDTDNKTLVEIIHAFVYYSPSNRSDVGVIIDKFLKDNDLTQAYINYSIDIKEKDNPSTYFNRSSLSEREMIENVRLSFLSLGFNRLRQSIVTPTVITQPKSRKPRVVKDKLVEPTKVKMTYKDDGDSDVHIVSGNDDYTLCGNMIEGDFADSKLNVKSKVTCKHCLNIVKSCKTYKV